MKSSEKIQNSRKIVKFVIILMLIIMAIVLAGIAYARYVTRINGNTTAEIAKWSFKVVDGNAETVDVLDFPITRTDNNTHVDEGTIAPGTYGKFEIDVDARGTETILTYEIAISFTDKPVNLKFYSDEAMTNEIELDSNGNLIISEFLSLDDVKYIQSNLIYWKWALETGNTEAEIETNDLLDSEYMGKTLTMAITVTGIQGQEYLLAENPAYSTTVNGETTNFTNLQSAINEAGTSSGAVVKVLKNATSAGATIGEKQDITLDLNGKTLTTSELITNEGELKIRDSSANKTGKISTSSYISQLGDFTLESGTIEGTGAHHVIEANKVGSSITMTGGTINQTANGNYRCINMTKGNLTITDGELNSKYRCFESLNNNNIINVSGGTFTAIGGSNITYQVEACYINAAKELNISGGTFTAKRGESTHGAWGMQLGSNVKSANITGGTFEGYNMAIGVYCNVTISNATLTGTDYSSIYSYASSDHTITINGGTVINAKSYAIYNSSNSNVVINGGTLAGNYGFSNNSTGNLEVNGGTITGKTSGIVVGSGTFYFNGGTIKGKTSSIDGTSIIPTGYHRVDGTDAEGYNVTYLESD